MRPGNASGPDCRARPRPGRLSGRGHVETDGFATLPAQGILHGSTGRAKAKRRSFAFARVQRGVAWHLRPTRLHCGQPHACKAQGGCLPSSAQAHSGENRGAPAAEDPSIGEHTAEDSTDIRTHGHAARHKGDSEKEKPATDPEATWSVKTKRWKGADGKPHEEK